MKNDDRNDDFDVGIIADGHLYEPQRVGGVDMLVGRDGALLEYSPVAGEFRLPNAADLGDLYRRGLIEVVPVATTGFAKARPLRSVRIFRAAKASTRPATGRRGVAAGALPTYGPRSPADLADAVATESALQPVLHPFVGNRVAYRIYLEAMEELNGRLGARSVDVLPGHEFDRLIAIGRFLADDADRPDEDATRH